MSRGQELITMDFLGIDESKENTSESAAGLNEKPIYVIKPLMVQQALSSRGLSEEQCKASRDSQGLEFEATSKIMKNLFPNVSRDSENLIVKGASGHVGIMEELFTERTGCSSNPTDQQYLSTFGNSSIGRCAYTTPLGKESADQLTIFYNGTVNVYDVFEKQAEAVISLAGNEISYQRFHSTGFDRGTSFKPITISSTITSINRTEEPLNSSKNSSPQQLLIQNLRTKLSLQRKQSLHRFLHNRKEYRMNRAAPYSHSHDEDSKVKPEDSKVRPELGLDCHRQGNWQLGL